MVGSSQNSPSSSRSLPPLAPAHEAAVETTLAQSYPHNQGGQPLHGFPVGIKLEHSPGASFSPRGFSDVTHAAQSAAVANLGAAPPPAGSPGSLSRTSSSHAIAAGVNPMAPPRGGNTPAWLCQPLLTPLPPQNAQRVYQLEGTPAMQGVQSGQGRFIAQQPSMQSPMLQQQNNLSMLRTLSEADISHQSAMSALTGTSVHHTAAPPSSASRHNFHQQPPLAGSSHVNPMSPQKLRASMSYQDLSCNSFKLGSPQTLPPLQTQTQPPAAAGQQQQQQQQANNMMVRVGSETHFIPETQASYFGMSRVPSAPYMQLEQQNSGAPPHFVLDSRMHSDTNWGPPSSPHIGQWAPDSRQVLGIKQQELSDMQVWVVGAYPVLVQLLLLDFQSDCSLCMPCACQELKCCTLNLHLSYCSCIMLSGRCSFKLSLIAMQSGDNDLKQDTCIAKSFHKQFLLSGCRLTCQCLAKHTRILPMMSTTPLSCQ